MTISSPFMHQTSFRLTKNPNHQARKHCLVRQIRHLCRLCHNRCLCLKIVARYLLPRRKYERPKATQSRTTVNVHHSTCILGFIPQRLPKYLSSRISFHHILVVLHRIPWHALCICFTPGSTIDSRLFRKDYCFTHLNRQL